MIASRRGDTHVSRVRLSIKVILNPSSIESGEIRLFCIVSSYHRAAGVEENFRVVREIWRRSFCGAHDVGIVHRDSRSKSPVWL